MCFVSLGRPPRRSCGQDFDLSSGEGWSTVSELSSAPRFGEKDVVGESPRPERDLGMRFIRRSPRDRLGPSDEGRNKRVLVRLSATAYFPHALAEISPGIFSDT